MHSDLRKPGCQNARSERAKSKCVFCFSMRFVFSGPVRPVVWSDRSRRGGRRAAFFLGWLACVFLGGVVGVFCWSVGRRGWGLRRVAVRCLQRNTRFFVKSWAVAIVFNGPITCLAQEAPHCHRGDVYAGPAGKRGCGLARVVVQPLQNETMPKRHTEPNASGSAT